VIRGVFAEVDSGPTGLGRFGEEYVEQPTLVGGAVPMGEELSLR
jgi:hypothetical protein